MLVAAARIRYLRCARLTVIGCVVLAPRPFLSEPSGV